MAEPDRLVASARIPLGDPAGMLEKLCDHFAEHGSVIRDGGTGRLESPFGTVDIEAAIDALQVRCEAPSLGYLFVIKSSVAEHVVEFAGEGVPAFGWSGDGNDVSEIPFFHRATVRASRRITPRMQRVTLTVEDAGRLEDGGLHVRVLIPPRGRIPVWPSVAGDGRAIWPKGEDELTGRVYTIRAIDKARNAVDIDVVLHDDSAGSVWALSAQPGDPVGLTGPGGGEIVPADWYLLCGDETALPVIARIAESLPAQARATLLIEVADAGEEQPISSAAAFDLSWLHRNGAEAGTTDLLERAVRAVEWPEGVVTYALIGCEQVQARALRAYLRKDRALPKDRHIAAAYWRRGDEAPLQERD
jgi:NADPH-dependent ferric siderophore reductase